MTDNSDVSMLKDNTEDFRFYTDNPKLRIDELALPLQWNEINLAMKSGSGSGLDILLATLL